MKGKELTLKGAFIITAVSKYSKVFINLVFTIILARLLTPDDYGIVAVVKVFINFFVVFSDMGISAGIIQNKELTDYDNNCIYSFTIFLGIFLGIVFAVFSFPMALFYCDKVYISIGLLMALCLMFTTWNMVPNALVMKQKAFKIAAVRAIVVAISGGIVTVILALIGFRYYALVISNIFGACFIYFWNKRYINLWFQKKISIKSIRKIFSFSLYQFAYNFVNYFSRNLDNLLIGKYMGAVELGYYDKAFTLTQHPISALSNVVAPALHPFLSEHQKRKDYIYKKHIDIVRIFLVFGIFGSVFVFYYASDIIVLMYGFGWLESISNLKWLGISLWAQLAVSCSSAIYQSLGDTKKLFLVGGINAGVSILCISVGVYTRDILVLSQMVAAAYIIHFFVLNFVLVKGIIKESFSKFLLSFWKEWLFAVILFIVGSIFTFRIENVFVNFIVELLYFGIIYFCLLWITGEYKVILRTVGFKSRNNRQQEGNRGKGE